MNTSSPSTLQVLLHVANKLCQIHGAGYAHRDVKPSNIILDSDTKQWMLIDFASAAQIGTNQTLSYTPLFAPPELGHIVSTGHNQFVVSGAVDVWALGIMAWTLLTGRLPYACGDDVIPKLLGHQLFPWEEKIDVKTNFKLGILKPAVLSMLTRDPEKRATIHQVHKEWNSLLHNKNPPRMA